MLPNHVRPTEIRLLDKRPQRTSRPRPKILSFFLLLLLRPSQDISTTFKKRKSFPVKEEEEPNEGSLYESRLEAEFEKSVWRYWKRCVKPVTTCDYSDFLHDWGWHGKSVVMKKRSMCYFDIFWYKIALVHRYHHYHNFFLIKERDITSASTCAHFVRCTAQNEHHPTNGHYQQYSNWWWLLGKTDNLQTIVKE